MTTREPFRPFDYISSHPQGIPLKNVEPTPAFVRDVEWALGTIGDNPLELARWIADIIEEHGSQFARPMFSMEGNGPFCSYCGTIGAICGHPERAIGAEPAEVIA